MNKATKTLIGAAMVGSSLVGGGVGAALFANSGASAQTSTTTTPATQAPQPGVQPDGTFHSNEDATHEAGESAQREAQENAGQRPTVP
jgi:hypothetical protein